MLEIKEMHETVKSFQTYSDKCQKRDKRIHIRDGKVLCDKGWVCVPNIPELKEKIHEEVHQSRYYVYPENTKMYHNLQEYSW